MRRVLAYMVLLSPVIVFIGMVVGLFATGVSGLLYRDIVGDYRVASRDTVHVNGTPRIVHVANNGVDTIELRGDIYQCDTYVVIDGGGKWGFCEPINGTRLGPGKGMDILVNKSPVIIIHYTHWLGREAEEHLAISFFVSIFGSIISVMLFITAWRYSDVDDFDTVTYALILVADALMILYYLNALRLMGVL